MLYSTQDMADKLEFSTTICIFEVKNSSKIVI